MKSTFSISSISFKMAGLSRLSVPRASYMRWKSCSFCGTDLSASTVNCAVRSCTFFSAYDLWTTAESLPRSQS